MQHTLFDTPLPIVILSKKKEAKVVVEKTSNISWSFSKMEMLNSCPRKYYYNYFGKSKRKAKDDDNKEEIALYSTMSNKHTTVGDIIHICISRFLGKSKKEEYWDFSNLKWLANQQINDRISHTKKLKNSKETNNTFPISPIKELFDGSMTENEFLDFANDKIEQSLSNFYNSEHFEFIKDNASYSDSIIERKANFKLGNITIDGAIDVAFEDGGKFHIVDWKTSYSTYEETSVQLLVYALWTIEKFGKDIEDICIHKAFLLDGNLETLDFSQKHIERAKAKIKQSVEAMIALEKYGTDGVIEAFDCCDEPNVCKLCPFEKICKS